ncbi:hypothetical protein BDV18DRAFT_10877 [Aspergillus unguis]
MFTIQDTARVGRCRNWKVVNSTEDAAKSARPIRSSASISALALSVAVFSLRRLCWNFAARRSSALLLSGFFKTFTSSDFFGTTLVFRRTQQERWVFVFFVLFNFCFEAGAVQTTLMI